MSGSSCEGSGRTGRVRAEAHERRLPANSGQSYSRARIPKAAVRPGGETSEQYPLICAKVDVSITLGGN